MEWNRAKGILIILFAVLNLILAVCIVSEISGDRISEDVIDSTVQILKSKDIEVKCDIPSKIIHNMILTFEREYTLPTMSADSEFKEAEYIGENAAEWSGEYLTGEEFKNQDEFREAAVKSIIKEFELSWAELKFFQSVTDEDGAEITYIYYGHFQGYTVADTFIKAVFFEDSMKHFEIHAYKPEKVNRREQGTAAINAILLKHYSEEGPDSINLIEPAFMNYIDAATVSDSESVPFIWIIGSDNGIRYFRGADGAEIFGA